MFLQCSQRSNAVDAKCNRKVSDAEAHVVQVFIPLKVFLLHSLDSLPAWAAEAVTHRRKKSITITININKIFDFYIFSIFLFYLDLYVFNSFIVIKNY